MNAHQSLLYLPASFRVNRPLMICHFPADLPGGNRMGSFFRTRQTLRRCGYAARAAFPQLRFVDSPSPGPQSVRFFAHPIDVTGFLSCSQRWLCFFESANHPAIPAAGVLREIHSCASICIRGRHFHFGGRTAASGGRALLIAVSFRMEAWLAPDTIRSFGSPNWVRFVKRVPSRGQKPICLKMKALQIQMASFFRARQTLRRCGHAARAAFPQSRFRFVDLPSPAPQWVRFFAHAIGATGFLPCGPKWLYFFEWADHPAIPPVRPAGFLRQIHPCDLSASVAGISIPVYERAASGGRAPLIAVSFCVEMWFALQTIRSFGRPIWVRFVKRASSLGQKPHLPDMKALQLQMASFFRARRTRRRCGHAARAAFPQSRFRFVDPRSVCIRVHPWPAFSSQTT
jgi:hypothetical protein